MTTVVNEDFEIGRYFLEQINNPTGLLVARLAIIAVALFVVGFYIYIKKNS